MNATNQYNESELLGLTASGDGNAFRKIYNNYSNRLYAYSLRITEKEDLAEEIVQDVFIKIWTNRAELTAIDRFDSYLYVVARNHCFNSLKRIAREAVILKELSKGMTELHNEHEEAIIHKEYLKILNDSVSKLPPQQQLIYNLSRNSGLKYDEIALTLNLSKNTVKAHLKKALYSIRSNFSKYRAFIIILLTIITER